MSFLNSYECPLTKFFILYRLNSNESNLISHNLIPIGFY